MAEDEFSNFVAKPKKDAKNFWQGILATPATSASSQRVFFIAGLTIQANISYQGWHQLSEQNCVRR